MDDVHALREDIAELRSIIDSVLDRHGDRALLEACVDVLRDRQERLDALEQDLRVSRPA